LEKKAIETNLQYVLCDLKLA